MNTDGTGLSTCKECHKTESLWNHTTTDHNEGEQLEDRRNVGESSCNFGDRTGQRVQSLMFMMTMMMCSVGISNQMFWRAKRYKLGGRGFYARWCHWNFHRRNPSGRAMALGSTQPITEIVPGIFSDGKGGRCVGLTTLPHLCADCLEIWEPKPPGTMWVCKWTAWTVRSNTVQYVRFFSIVRQLLYFSLIFTFFI